MLLAQFKYKSRASSTSPYASLWVKIPCTCSLPTPHICSTSNQRHIWNPVEHLQWSFLAEIVNVCHRRAPPWMFDTIFDGILNATLPNNLLYLQEGLRKSFPPLELHKEILDSACLLILLIYTSNKKNSSSRLIKLTRVTNCQANTHKSSMVRCSLRVPRFQPKQ